MLDHSPGNGKSVKGTGATSNLIQDQKAPCSCIPQNICNLCHLYHKGTLTTCQIIRRTYTGKNPVKEKGDDIVFLRKIVQGGAEKVMVSRLPSLPVFRIL